jgi:hypothetical protein
VYSGVCSSFATSSANGAAGAGAASVDIQKDSNSQTNDQE